MASQEPMGWSNDSIDQRGSQISMAELLELCREIDESWNEEAIIEQWNDFYLTDSGFLKMRLIDDWVHVDMLSVLPKYRGGRVARDLIGAAEETASALNLRGVCFETIIPHFFSRLGYKALGILPGFARGKDLTVMSKEIERNV